MCSPVCGDGIVVGNELSLPTACDDHNTKSGDGCSSTCSVECGFECAGGSATTPDECHTSCGDGIVADLEQCDDGDAENGDGCSSTCAIETDWDCVRTTACGMSNCLIVVCGDGKVTGAESSDQRCDDGNTVDGDGCDGTCMVECGYVCSMGGAAKPDFCTTACGDGVIAGVEVCDDGNKQDGDGCTTKCRIEPGWDCTWAACEMSECKPVCGDGRVVGSEVGREGYCDDDNTDSDDGCSRICTVECGFACKGATSSSADHCTSSCGDGKLAVDEECDDGNLDDEDGCDATCFREADWGTHAHAARETARERERQREKERERKCACIHTDKETVFVRSGFALTKHPYASLHIPAVCINEACGLSYCLYPTCGDGVCSACVYVSVCMCLCARACVSTSIVCVHAEVMIDFVCLREILMCVSARRRGPLVGKGGVERTPTRTGKKISLLV